MRLIIQRVSAANVTVDKLIVGQISKGLCILLGVEEADTADDIEWLCTKIDGLRIFNDADGKMNVNHKEAQANFLVISQFTLYASTKKGTRPSFIKAANPIKAKDYYEQFKKQLAIKTNKEIESGIFGADMQVALTNDGPVTIIIDSKNKE